ncbi:hypothetical protein NXV89_22645 [Bacteroides uniformis]|nr:hypothetical protein [Bacteroides uniformis]
MNVFVPNVSHEWRSKLLRKGGFIPVKVNSKGQVSLPIGEKSLLSAPPGQPVANSPAAM